MHEASPTPHLQVVQPGIERSVIFGELFRLRGLDEHEQAYYATPHPVRTCLQIHVLVQDLTIIL